MKTADFVKQQCERESAIKALRRDMPTGSYIYGMTTKRTAGGNVRYVRVFIVEDGRIREKTATVARVIESKHNDNGIKVTGWNFSALGSIVDGLNHVLWPKAESADLLKGESL